MDIRNIEFKVKVQNNADHEARLLQLQPDFRGIDHQVDTYFNAKKGRLKLREGNIENALIYYERGNTADAKLSQVQLFKFKPDPVLKSILAAQLGIKVVVDKRRKIYFVRNVKFHFDEVDQLGSFAEVEAIDSENEFSDEELRQQCQYYFEYLGFDQDMLIKDSYSDLLLDAASTPSTKSIAD